MKLFYIFHQRLTLMLYLFELYKVPHSTSGEFVYKGFIPLRKQCRCWIMLLWKLKVYSTNAKAFTRCLFLKCFKFYVVPNPGQIFTRFIKWPFKWYKKNVKLFNFLLTFSGKAYRIPHTLIYQKAYSHES